MQGSCAGGEAPEQVYRVTIERRAQLSALLTSTYDGALYILRTCGAMQTELVCNDDAPDQTRAQVDVTLEPGEYFIVVDGYGAESGEYDLVVQVADLQSISAICGDAAALVPGQPMSASTTGFADYFQATCAGGARSADRVYTLDVPSRSRLRVRQQSDHDGAVHVRRTCDDPTTEVACNDDFRDQNHSLVTAIVDAGRYFVVADGYASGQAGNFTLTADLTSDAGGSADGESCQAPGTLTPGQLVDIDTFEARDDFAGSCGGRGGADVVYAVTVTARSHVRATVGESELSGAVYLERTCGDATTELGCTVLQQNTPASVEATLDPGTYYVVVDGDRPDSFGAAKLDVRVTDLVALDRTCRRAPLIRPGRPISGSTVPESDTFQASCAGGAQSNDVVYRLQLRRRQIVRLALESDYDGVLHLRRDCTDTTSEIACNDDQDDNRHSLIETTLDPGMYYVVVDGFGTGNAGTFTLNVQTSNP
jgi:hypothetical protein